MKRFVSLVVAALLLTIPLFASATTVKKLDFNALTLTSDQIVKAEIVSQTTKEDPRSKKIYTIYKLRVDERLKGEMKEISIRLLGGESNGIALRIPGMHYPKVGEKGVFFLKRYGKFYQPRGMNQGHYVLTLDDAKVERVVRDMQSTTVFDPKAQGKARFTHGTKVEMTYADLAQKVRTVLNQGK